MWDLVRFLSMRLYVHFLSKKFLIIFCNATWLWIYNINNPTRALDSRWSRLAPDFLRVLGTFFRPATGPDPARFFRQKIWDTGKLNFPGPEYRALGRIFWLGPQLWSVSGHFYLPKPGRALAFTLDCSTKTVEHLLKSVTFINTNCIPIVWHQSPKTSACLL